MVETPLGPHRPIIEKFGGITAAARALGHKHPTTVQGWWESGWIPTRQQPHVLQAAIELDLDLTAEDFVKPPDPTRPEGAPDVPGHPDRVGESDAPSEKSSAASRAAVGAAE